MKEPKQPFWKKLQEKFRELSEEPPKAPEPPRPAPPPSPAPAPARPMLPPGVEHDTLIKGGIRLRRNRYVTRPLPPVDYQTGDLPPGSMPPPMIPPVPEAVDPYAMEGATDAQLSDMRLQLIEAFDKGEFPLPQMRDSQYMFRLITDEREYQRVTLKEMRREYVLARGEGEDVLELELRLKRHGVLVQHLFQLLKGITGQEGSTGGSGFI